MRRTGSPSAPTTILLLILLLCLAAPALAQEPTPGPVTHVVQAGDTLYGIAQRFGVTVETIAAANNITDPALIAVGQKLVIPNAMSGAAPAAFPSPTPLPDRRVHPVRPGETLPFLAFRYGTTVQALREMNGLGHLGLLGPGQELVIPPPASPTLRDRRFPSISIRPAPVVQGQTVLVEVQSSYRLEISGSFLEQPLTFVREGEGYWALAGVDAMTPPGAYPLSLSAASLRSSALNDGGGDRITMQETITVTAGSFPTANIRIPASRQYLLDPDLSRTEREQVEQVFAGVSRWRLWDSALSSPLTGALQPTSPFGQRRSYAGGPVSSYHSGQDYSAAEGVPVHAPAGGLVALAEPLDVRGQAIILDHGRGVFSGFWHLSRIDVVVGQEVKRGQVIGLVGNTGLSTGSHLHWEMQVWGVPVNPIQWTQEAFLPTWSAGRSEGSSSGR